MVQGTAPSRSVVEGLGSFTRVARVVGASASLVGHALVHLDRLIRDVLADSAEVARESRALYGAAAAEATAAQEALRRSPRFARVLSDLTRIIASYKLHARKALFLSPEAAADTLARLHEVNAERIHRMCVELRGGVLKVGQFVSTRADLLPAPYLAQLSLLQDSVPPIPFSAIAARIEAEVGGPLEPRFAAVDPEPLATASLAQVHAARLPGGREVVLKVQLPGVEELVEADLAALRVLARALGNAVAAVDLRPVAAELTRAVREELDFEAEARHVAGFADRFRGDDAVVIPGVHPEASSRRVLTLDRLPGERLLDFLDACEARGAAGAADRDRILSILVRAFASQILEHGCFHADPHPGNFLVLPGPRLGIVDFGSVRYLEEPVRRAYARLVLAVVLGDGSQVPGLLRELGFEAAPGEEETLREYAALILESLRANATFDIAAVDPQAQIARALELAARGARIRVPDHFVALGRVLAALGGLLMRYRPRVNLFEELVPRLASAAAGNPPDSPPPAEEKEATAPSRT